MALHIGKVCATNWKTAAIVLLALSGGATADAVDDWFKKFSGTYWIYSGSLGDSAPPTSTDRKLGFAIHGTVAREIFNAIGPDVHDLCTEGDGIRIRRKDNERLSCSRSRKAEYQCNFGFDLRTGKSIGGIIC